jgi:hypothetical protein
MSNKVMIKPNSVRPNQDRIKREEAELEALMKGETPEPEQEEVVEEAVTEEVAEVKEQPKAEPEDENLSSEEKTFKKRYGDLRRHSAKEKQELEDRIAALENQSKDVKPPKTEEELKAWARKYPDVASIIETIADRKASEKFEAADARLKLLDEREEAINRSNAEAAIIKAHPNFNELKNSDDFHDWVADQPKWVQDALYENEDDPDSVVRVIDLYNVDNGLTPSARKKSAREAASAVPSRPGSAPAVKAGQATFRESDVQKMSDKAFEKNWEQIQKDMKTPGFYDLTGGAR